jgi:hypothetical protein
MKLVGIMFVMALLMCASAEKVDTQANKDKEGKPLRTQVIQEPAPVKEKRIYNDTAKIRWEIDVSEEPTVDWVKITALAHAIQSKVAKEDIEDLGTSVIKMLNLIPSNTKYYSAGFSFGDENVLYYNYAEHLTGKSWKLKLDWHRMHEPDCVYVEKGITGPTVFFTGEALIINTCEKVPKYFAGPVGLTPIVGRMGRVVLRKSGASKISALEPPDFFKNLWEKYPDSPVALDPASVDFDKMTEGLEIRFVGGYLAKDETGKRIFKVKFDAVLRKSGDVRLARVLRDEWRSCTRCQGVTPQQYITDF